MGKPKGFVFWFFSTVIIFGVFLIFVSAGWVGEPDECVKKTPHECYCEDFKVADVLKNKPGVRQPVNTWLNLYSIGTSFFVAWFIYKDRRLYTEENTPNLFGSTNSYIPDLYIFAVLFLGLGSMWFHASLTAWGGMFDGLSMYVYASFLVFYTLRRFYDSEAVFWLGYLCSVLFFTLLHCMGIPSYINIGLLILAYTILEVYIWYDTGKIMQGRLKTVLLWLSALVSILLATFFWFGSKEVDSFLCSPKDWFQVHGIFWHPLAGVMAMLLYFYWSNARDREELGTKI